MNVSKALPQVPNGGRGPLDVEVPYPAPRESEQTLAILPKDAYSPTYPGPFETVFFSSQTPQPVDGRPVLLKQPVFDADGKAEMEEKKAAFRAETPDPWKSAGKSALRALLPGLAGGAVVGAAVGLAAESLGLGLGTGALATAAGVGIGALSGHHEATQQRLALGWQPIPLVETRVIGYTKSYEHHSDGKGFDVHYAPIYHRTDRGSSMRPVLMQHREGEEPVAPAPPPPERLPDPPRLDLGYSNSGLGTSVNHHGQFITAGDRGIVYGRIENGKTLYDFVRAPDGQPLDLGYSESGLGTSLNDKGQFVVAGDRGIVFGTIRDRDVEYHLMEVDGQPLDLGYSESGLGAALNDSGQFVVGGDRGIAYGTIEGDRAEVKFMKEKSGELLDLGYSDSGIGVSISSHGHFVVAGDRGVVLGAIKDGEAHFERMHHANGEPLDLGYSESGLGASMNDSGQFVVAGDRGIVYGQVREGGKADFEFLKTPSGEPLDLGYSKSGLGAAINESGQFMVAGDIGIIHGKIDGQGASYEFLADENGRRLDLGYSESGLAVSLNDAGLFSVAGDIGMVHGQIEDGKVTFHRV
ncbi:MAG: hypothetical protein HY319_32505 [Armatimonadetes bacterium]|nr:hypothetical protein [Armatimonadota bacterium]